MTKSSVTQHVQDTHLWMMINTTGFAIYRARELELLQFGLTMEQTTILHILTENGGSLLITDFFTELHRRPNSIYTLLDRMAHIGLVTKEREPDSRKTLIKISEKGTRLFESLTNKTLELAFAPLSYQQKVLLSTILIKTTMRAREFLGFPNKPRMNLYRQGHNIDKPPSILLNTLENLPESKQWAILNNTRFTINHARQMELGRFGFTVEQYMLLYILNREEKPVSINKIISKTMRQPASVYSLINRMGKRKIVKIKKPDYNTVSSVSISPTGQRLFDAITNESLDYIFSGLSVKQKQQLNELLEIINHHMRNILGINSFQPDPRNQ